MIRRADTMLREMQQDEQGLVQLVCVSHGVRMPKDWSITTDERGRAISIVPRVPSGQSTGGEAAKAEDE